MPVAMKHELPGLTARGSESEAHQDVVQAALEQAEQILASHALLAAGLCVIRAELLLQNAVEATGLLLLAQLQPVLGLLGAAAAVIAGRVGTALDAALVG